MVHEHESSKNTRRGMKGAMFRLGAIFLCFWLAIAAFSSAAAAEEGKNQVLGEAVVHVLSAEGDPVPDAEVVLVISRADNVEDRRMARTGGDGVARFVDVRLDCLELKAVVRTAAGDVEGKSRACTEKPEAFVVLPQAAPATPPAQPDPQPAPTVQEDASARELQTAAQPPASKEKTPETAGAEDADETEIDEESLESAEPGMFAFTGRAGVDFCMEWFYRPNTAQGEVPCKDNDPVGFSLGVDLGVHVVDWLSAGLALGYRYYGGQIPSRTDTAPPIVSFVPYADADATDDAEAEKPSATDGSNHLLLLGIGLRAEWTPGKWILGVLATPLGVHRHILTGPAGSTAYNDFYIQFGALVGYRFFKTMYLGLYGEVFQPLPWIEDSYYTGSASVGLATGARFGPGRSLSGR